MLLARWHQLFRRTSLTGPYGAHCGTWRWRGSARQPPPVMLLVVLPVLARPNRPPPPLVVPVPLDRLLQPLREPPRRLPPQVAKLRARQRVAPVVPGPVGHVLDQRLVAIGCREDAPHNVDVRGLVRSADVVDLARQPLPQHEVDR